MKLSVIVILVVIHVIFAIPPIPVSHSCYDPNCFTCLQIDKTHCIQCKQKTFLHNHKCLLTCPLNTFSDVLQRKCIPVSPTTKRNHFLSTKAYSIGSCENICGYNINEDCSCTEDCISKGNCCSDYSSACEQLYQKSSSYCEISNCKLCYSNTQCGQCNEGYWLRNGECVKHCAPNDIEKIPNKVCNINRQCYVSNCDECDRGNGKKCIKCENGYFYYKNQCVEECPKRTLADRLSWSCVEVGEFAFYWVFPSSSTCRDSCGRRMERDSMDCSCDEKCFQKGNCCGDIEQFCKEYLFWKY